MRIRPAGSRAAEPLTPHGGTGGGTRAGSSVSLQKKRQGPNTRQRADRGRQDVCDAHCAQQQEH